MREKIEYAFVKLFLWLAKVTPKSFIYFFVKRMTLLVYFFDKRRRVLTIKNLSLAYPNKSSDEIILMSKKVYTELSKTISEILLMFVDRFNIDEAIVNKDEAIKQLEYLKQNSSQGIIAMTAHFSNWELLAHFLAKYGFPMLVIGRAGNNKLIEEKITTPFRQKYGNDSAYKDKAMLTMVKRLKKGGNVGILIDQKAGHLNSVNVDFFGEKVDTTTSIAMLKQKLNPLVIPFFIARVEQGKYKIIIKDAIETSLEIDSIENMTEKYNQVMESVIREYPEQWFWMHNRWRR